MIHASPGAYALLLGSGTSRSAGIPTGWEIAIDLIGRVAAAEGSPDIADPEAWYREHHGEDADYSRLLEYLAPASGDRQAILNPYFTPDEDELEQGLKAPTKAHRAIAELVRLGVIKVIVTTNFDRLVERALQDVGVEPHIVSSGNGAAAAPPLHAIRCMVIKVHGDQSSPDLRNTLAELDAYDEPMNDLLARVLDEHGLIVCGWSATWDPALRRLLVEHRSRYYSTFWTVHGEPSPQAQEVLKCRTSTPLTISDADSFFDELAGKVAAIRELHNAGPRRAEVAVAELKRYLDNPTARVRMIDLVRNQTKAVIDATGSDRLPVAPSRFDPGDYEAHLGALEAATGPLVDLVANLGFYASEKGHDDLAVGVIRQLVSQPRQRSGITALLNAQLYPATLTLFALGLGALANRRPQPFARALAEVVVNEDGHLALPVTYYLAPSAVLDHGMLDDAEEFKRRFTPSSDRVHARLRSHLEGIIPNADEYDGFFDDLEYLIGLAVFEFRNDWGPIGRFGWRRRYPARGPRDRIIQDHADEIFASGLFSASSDRFAQAKTAYDAFIDQHGNFR